jgi:hypothetical protein
MPRRSLARHTDDGHNALGDKLVHPNQHEAAAVDARQELDLKVRGRATTGA